MYVWGRIPRRKWAGTGCLHHTGFRRNNQPELVPENARKPNAVRDAQKGGRRPARQFQHAAVKEKNGLFTLLSSAAAGFGPIRPLFFHQPLNAALTRARGALRLVWPDGYVRKGTGEFTPALRGRREGRVEMTSDVRKNYDDRTGIFWRTGLHFKSSPL